MILGSLVVVKKKKKTKQNKKGNCICLLRLMCLDPSGVPDVLTSGESLNESEGFCNVLCCVVLLCVPLIVVLPCRG